MGASGIELDVFGLSFNLGMLLQQLPDHRHVLLLVVLLVVVHVLAIDVTWVFV